MRETRTMKLEMRAEQVPTDNNSDAQQKVIEGYALEFNTLSDDLGGFRETLAPDCLKNADMSDVRCFLNHDSNLILGRTGKNLALDVDDKGLHYRCVLPDRDYADNVYRNIKDGLINQCSFGFVIADGGEQWEEQEDGTYLRTITNIAELFDVSPVAIPAYRATQVEAASRSLDAFKKEQQAKIEQRKKQIELAKIKLKLSTMDD